jgi:PncC family amidohydrolase
MAPYSENYGLANCSDVRQPLRQGGERGVVKHGNPAFELVREFAARSLTLALAESCTAGLAADSLACVSGASKVLWGSFVCYTVDAKVKMLGVDGGIVARYGAVSAETASAMATGALEKSGADAAAAVTGLAGPDGDGSAVPVGTVWIAVRRREGESEAEVFHFSGARNEIRQAACEKLLEKLLNFVKK